MKYLVYPYHEAMHWALIIVEINYNSGITIFLYDPLILSSVGLEEE